MRRLPLYAPLFAVLAIAGCESGTGAAQSAPPANILPQQQKSSACVVGKWRSDGVSTTIPHVSLSGGGGVAFTIAPDGQSDVDFTGMSPENISLVISAQQKIDSRAWFGGKLSGRLRLPPAGASSGTWEVERGADWGDVRMTLEAFGTKAFDNVPVATIADKDEVKKTNTKPLLGAGKYTCTEGKLTIEQQVLGASETWTLHREH